MEVARIRALRGPNLWSSHTALEAVVHCESHELVLNGRSLGFEQRLYDLLPYAGALHAQNPSMHLTMAHALELSALGLQAQAGCPVTFSRTVATDDAGVFLVIVQYTEEATGRMALEQAGTLCRAAATGQDLDVEAVLQQLRELDEDERLGPSTASIADAARARGVPVRRLTRGSLLQFGWGCRQRRIQAAEIDATSAIAENIAQDKDLTKKLLHASGLPVPRGRPVDDVEDAWAAALDIGLPVVVKPRDGNQGKGVTVGVGNRSEFEAAYVAAARHGKVIVESCLRGHDYRLLVVGDKLVAAARRDPPLVIGDGQHSVRELVQQINSDPRRGSGHGTAMTKILLDDIALGCLAAQGLDADAVPARGHRAVLRNNANLSTGGSATDVTDSVHPDVSARAVEAAQAVGLDICGVDIVCETVIEPLEEQNGGILEVNAAPGLRMHLSPSFGQRREVGRAVIKHMYPHGDSGRIPLVAVTGTNGKTTTVRLTAHLLAANGLRVGMTHSDGVEVDGCQIDTGDCSGPRSARKVLAHPDVEAAVLETARGGLLREGLAFDRCDVAVVTNIGNGDHLGLDYITTLERLRDLKRVIVLHVATTGTAVLNAADPNVAAMARHCPGDVIFFASDGKHPIVATHRAQGRRVVFVEHGDIVCTEDDMTIRLPLSQIPLTADGNIRFQVENVMAAVAAGWALAVPWDTMRKALTLFNANHHTPGRFNRFDCRGATIIADYGHNPDAIASLVDGITSLPARRRLVVISGAGDRRDEDIRSQTRILGAAFDEIILYEDACQRGRSDGEVLALLRQGLEGAARTIRVAEIHGEMPAIDHALDRLQAGDLCLILIDQVQEALAHIEARCMTVAGAATSMDEGAHPHAEEPRQSARPPQPISLPVI